MLSADPSAVIRFLSAVPFTVLSELLVWQASLIYHGRQWRKAGYVRNGNRQNQE